MFGKACFKEPQPVKDGLASNQISTSPPLHVLLVEFKISRMELICSFKLAGFHILTYAKSLLRNKCKFIAPINVFVVDNKIIVQLLKYLSSVPIF